MATLVSPVIRQASAVTSDPSHSAAAQAVVEAAGGGISTLDGAPLAYQKPRLLNPDIYTWGDDQLDWEKWVANG